VNVLHQNLTNRGAGTGCFPCLAPPYLGTDEIKWNFTKFLIDRDGNVVRRYEPTVTPEEIRTDLDPLLTS
jgi:glutathione peroxidase-family protein